MKQRLSSSARAGLSVLIVLVVLALGGWFLIYPQYLNVKQVDEDILEMQEKVEHAEQMLAANQTVTQRYHQLTEELKVIEKYFYKEMTDTEVADYIEDLMDEFGAQMIRGVTTTRIGAKDLTLTPPPQPPVVVYDIRQYAFLQGFQEEGTIQGDSDFNLTQAEAVKLLNADLTFEERGLQTELSPEERRQVIAILRSQLYGQHAQIGIITATFSLDLTYNDYLRLMTFVHDLKLATDFQGGEYLNESGDGSERKVRQISLNMYVIKEMQKMYFPGEEDEEIEQILEAYEEQTGEDGDAEDLEAPLDGAVTDDTIIT